MSWAVKMKLKDLTDEEFDEDGDLFEQATKFGEAVAARLRILQRALHLHSGGPNPDDLDEHISEFDAFCNDMEEGNRLLNDLFDWADRNRVWMDGFGDMTHTVEVHLGHGWKFYDEGGDGTFPMNIKEGWVKA